MAIANSRPRLCLVLGVGLTVLVVLLFQFRYYVTQAMFHPRRFLGQFPIEASPTAIRKDTDLSVAPPKLKDRATVSEKLDVSQPRKRARKKGRSSLKPVTIQRSAHDVSRSQPQKKFNGSQASAKVIQKQKHRTWIQSNREQNSEKRISDSDKQEPQGPKCQLTSATILDIKQLQPCGVWIRTCERECLCKQNKPVTIPRVVHFIKDDNLTFSDWLAVIAAKKYIKPTKINLFTRDDISPNCWMRRLRLIDNVNIIGLTAKQWLKKVNNVTVPYVEHQSDLLRNAILYHYGGIYMDTDAIATKSFDSLLSGHSVVLGQNLVNKTGNGLILARRQSCLMCDYALLACDSYDGSWRKHSTVSLSTLVQMNDINYDLLLLSNTSGFFPFSWKKKHFHQLFDLNSAQVSFSPTQVYALHLFGSKFPDEIVERFSNLTWINESPSVLASHMRTLIHSQLLKPSHLNETVCIDLPPKLLG